MKDFLLQSSLPMDAKTYLVNYAKKADKYLDRFFAEKKKEAVKISPICAQMIDVYRDHLRGGKKARGALMVLGYLLAGGKTDTKIYRASIFPEIIQSFLLIHDDVIDRDLTRRGKATPQAFYTSLHQKRKFPGDTSHFGLSMAVVLGDLGIFLAQGALWESGFSKEKIFNVLELTNKVYQKVALGQALDVFGEASGKFSERYVLQIHRFKTAEYSVSAPLQFGAILAKPKKRLLKNLNNYGQSIGVAFQLHDDVLGLFGDEKVIGKPVGSDIKEGKVTLLVVKALEKANREDKAFLKKTYGREDISSREVRRIQGIVKKTDSLTYSLETAKKLVKKGKKYIPKITSDSELQNILIQFADFMIKREK